jgi:hypothetical protein
LRTHDGGKTWTNTAAKTKGLACGEWGWKIQFLNKKIGFIALENFRDAAILKTTDGGASWVRKHVAASQDPSAPAINNDLKALVSSMSSRVGLAAGVMTLMVISTAYTRWWRNWIRQDYDPANPSSGDQIPDQSIPFHRSTCNGWLLLGQQVFKLSASKKSAFGKKTAFGA